MALNRTPTLFNIYFNAMLSCWCDECREAGVTVLYKLDRKLVGDRTVKSKLHHVKITESQFADDFALYAGTRSTFETVGMSLLAAQMELSFRLTICSSQSSAQFFLF